MIKIPFCFKVKDLCVDEEGNKDYGYMKITLDGNKKLSDEDYNKIHKKIALNFEIEEIEPVSIEEYINECECEKEELEILENYIK